MHRSSLSVLVGLATCLVFTGCFFTQPINDQPEAEIQKVGTGPHFRGDVIVFSARKSRDAEGDALLVAWRARTCFSGGNGCDAPAFQELTGVSPSTNFEVQVPLFRVIGGEPSDLPTTLLSVELTVVDRRGARKEAQVFVDILNHEPKIVLQPQGLPAPSDRFFPIGIPVDVVAVVCDPDSDPLTVDWQLRPPGGSQVSEGQIIPAPDQDGCHVEVYKIVPDLAGVWRVDASADDRVVQAPIMASESISVQPDGPPCIAPTDPPFVASNADARYILDRADGPRRFAVLGVTDDLDTYPPPDPGDPYRGAASFRWFISSPDTGGQRTEIIGHDVADYTIDASAFAPGDRLSLQVEVTDRVARTQCDPALRFCALQGPPCYQRITWEAEIR